MIKNNLLTKILIVLGLAFSVSTFVSADRTANGVPGDGVVGKVLQSLGGGDSIWVATSSLGISGGTGVSNAYASSTFVTFSYASTSFAGLTSAYASSTFAGLFTNNTLTGINIHTGTTTLATTTLSVGSSTLGFTAPSLYFTNFWGGNGSTTGISASTGASLANLFVTTNASTSAFSASNASIGNFFNNAGTSTLLTFVTGTSTRFFTSFASTTNISGTRLDFLNATTTNLSGGGLSFTSGFIGTASTTIFSASTGATIGALNVTGVASTTAFSASTGATLAALNITGNASSTTFSASTGVTVSTLFNTGIEKVNGAMSFGSSTLAVSSGLLVGTTTQFLRGTVTNVSGYTSSSTITLNIDTITNGGIATTTINQTTTFANPVGTPKDGDMFELRALATTTQTIAWGTAFASSTDLNNVTSVASGTTRWIFEYSTDRLKWDLVALLKTFDR